MILIVDDLKENILSLKKILELHQLDVDTASSGEEALKKILNTSYELIILDVQMPGMDGFEVAETISGYSKAKDIPIIFLTAASIDKRFITKGYKSGGIDYVTKPFDPDILMLKVKTFTRLHEQTKKLNQIQQELRKEIEFRKNAEQQLSLMNQSLEQKIAERTESLIISNEQLGKKNLELQQFAYIASHDLKEPLRKIQIFGSMLRAQSGNETDGTEVYLDKIIRSANKMTALINDVFAYSSLDVPQPFEKTDLALLLQDVISDFDLRISETNASISIGVMPLIDIIPAQIRQVFQNLIGNAIKFARPDTAPLISIDALLTGELSFDAPAVDKKEATHCRITVRDNGIGFDEMYKERIFTIFQRLHAAGAFEGTGIGLAIVKKITDKHNGIITATSKVNEGSSFMLVLPLIQNHVSL